LLTDVWKLLKRKRSIAEGFGVPESTLRKRLKPGTVPTSVGRLKAAFSNEEETKIGLLLQKFSRQILWSKGISAQSGMALIADLTKEEYRK
jgi:hypothetical protein